ncbi:MAG: hypothetical protein H0U55_14835 [Rubrobacteraceae bacterium]|nr:hypothetical protein [Rubrobacteraceae bacterium]
MADSVGGSAAEQIFPPLPLEKWEESKETLHRYAQVVGKIRLRYAPFMNHWWHVTLYVSTRGLTTSPIPYGHITFEISFDLLDNRLVVSTSDGAGFSFALDDLPVADFYRRLVEGLGTLGIHVSINTTPFDLDDEQKLDENVFHCVCDRDYVGRYGRVLVQVDQVFKDFAGRFNGKQSPVQLYWHSFDLAVTRFSGRRAPQREGVDPVTREAYSHEIISFGFWPGNRNLREPAFYSYTAPEPEGLTGQPLRPGSVSWAPEGGTALLMYEDVRKSDSPRETLLDFLESAYQAGAKAAGWDIEDFRTEAAG